MSAGVDLRRLPVPIVQAGMGAVARHELAAAVSEAGGLGTIGGARAPIAEELAAARRLTGRPIAVNLVLPLLRSGDVRVAADADVVVTFWGRPRRLAAGTRVHQCVSVEEARAAEVAGADALIAQGVEAGGHVRGTNSADRAGFGLPTASPRRSRRASRSQFRTAGSRPSGHHSPFSPRRWPWTMGRPACWTRGRSTREPT